MNDVPGARQSRDPASAVAEFESLHSDQKDSDFDTIRVLFLLPIVCFVCYNYLDKSEFVGAMDMDWTDREKSQDQDS